MYQKGGAGKDERKMASMGLERFILIWIGGNISAGGGDLRIGLYVGAGDNCFFQRQDLVRLFLSPGQF